MVLGAAQNMKTDEPGSPSDGLMAVKSSRSAVSEVPPPCVLCTPCRAESACQHRHKVAGIQSQVRSAVVTQHRRM